MPYINSIAIKGLRGILEGRLEDLGDITIFVGKNNTGKSTVLEAIYLVSALNKDLRGHIPLRYILFRRGFYGPSIVQDLFYRGVDKIELDAYMNISKTFKLYLEIIKMGVFTEHIPILQNVGLNTATTTALKMNVTLNGLKGECYFYIDQNGRSHYITPTEIPDKILNAILIDWNIIYSYGIPEQVYSFASKVGGYKALEGIIEDLKLCYEDVQGLSVLSFNGRWILHVVFKDTSIPIYVMGDGFKMAFTYIALLNSVNKGVIMVEEPELHQHPSSLRLVSEAIVRSAKYRKNQIFISTHSLETVDFILEAAEKLKVEDKVKVFYFMLDKGRLHIVSYTYQEALKLRKDLEYDLRG